LFKKRFDYLRWGPYLFTGTAPYVITQREIENNESIRAHPHPNICAYHGVEVTKGFVTALIFTKYNCDLSTYVARGAHFDPVNLLSQLKAAITHIHALGFVHVDVKAENVFVDTSVQPARFVLGDFDSMHKEGEALQYKWGTPAWRDEELTEREVAVKEMDWYGLRMVEKWLRGKGWGRP
ncbi:hypothetical protein BU23DRAFT_388036, partial [Bimuria novae-zelandiae CBS 107.79]